MNTLRMKLTTQVSWYLQQMNPIPYFPKWAHIKSKHRMHILKDGIVSGQGDFVNHIEMAGLYTAAIISYGIKEGKLRLNKHLAFPTLRYNKKTRANVRHNFEDDLIFPGEVPLEIRFDGILYIKSKVNDLIIIRKIAPLYHKMGLLETVSIQGHGRLKVINKSIKQAFKLDQSFTIEKKTIGLESSQISVEGAYEFKQYYYAYQLAMIPEGSHEARENLISDLKRTLVFESPNKKLNELFDFCKLRVCESIFKTKNGYMHSPGGGGYYAAMWANDECEYVNPLIPFIGYDIGIEQAVNSYRMFAKYDPIPSSIISEGDHIFSNAKDRGDTAMFLYGCSRFILASGKFVLLKMFWDRLKEAAEFLLSNKNKYGVIKSDSDELENRLPSGKANLFTSSLTYDALISCSYLAKAMGEDSSYYVIQADQLKSAIENYFGKTIRTFKTYRYHKRNRLLRAWISVPITMGILDRKDHTMAALNLLWHEEGVRSIEGYDSYWDRATLYALRAGFIAGHEDSTLKKLLIYTDSRLLSSHAPYPIESFPEGNQKQLSGESALFIRVITEGLLGIRVIGLNEFYMNPKLPSIWSTYKLSHIKIFDKDISIEVSQQAVHVTGARVSSYRDGYLINVE